MSKSTCKTPDSEKVFPNNIVGDEAFQLIKFMMNRYSIQLLSHVKRTFNY